MTARRLAPIGIALIAAATLTQADAQQTQRDPQRTAPPPAAPPRDGGTAPATTGTATIRGVVTSEESTPRPVRRAMVSLTATGLTQRVTLTDDEGRFVFTDLPAGRFRLAAMKSGWIRGHYGSRMGRGTGTTIALADGQRVTADVTMLPGAVIAGRIVDQFGRPQAGVRPLVMELRTAGGERVLRIVQGAVSTLQSITDDRGEYRIYGLPPGTYIVSATPPPQTGLAAARIATADEIAWARRQAGTSAGSTVAPAPGPPVGLAPVFYPGTTDASAATPIVLEAGVERTGVDFPMRLVPMARVDGVVTNSDGQPAPRVQISIAAVDAVFNPYDAAGNRAVVSPQGTFSFPAVRPGQYRITARASSQPGTGPLPPPGSVARPAAQAQAPDLYAITDVSVRGQDLDNVILVLQPGTRIAGRMVFEGSSTTPLPVGPRAYIALTPATGMASTGRPVEISRAYADAGGVFSMAGIMPGRYTVAATVANAAGAPSPWMARSIVMNGRDVSDEVIEIRPNEQFSDVVVTLTDRIGEITGTIFDAAGRPSPGMYVVVFPAERRAWGVISRRFRPPSLPSTDGKYSVSGLPPGEYLIAALTDLDEANAGDQQSFLEQLAAAAIKVTLKEGEKKVQDLRIR